MNQNFKFYNDSRLDDISINLASILPHTSITSPAKQAGAVAYDPSIPGLIYSLMLISMIYVIGWLVLQLYMMKNVD